MPITSRGRHVFGNLTEQGRLVVGSQTETGEAVFGTVAEPPSSAPTITIVSISRSKISDETGMDRATVRFTFDQEVVEWRVRVLGTSETTGTLADSSLITLPAGTEATAEIDYTELYQEGENRVNIYGKNSAGLWTPYG